MDRDGRGVNGRLMSGLLLAFCCGHAVFLIYSVFPRRSAADDHKNAALDLYRLVFSGRQQWNLFYTIPLQHSMDIRLEGDDGTGGKIEAGSILPGLKPYPQPEEARYYGVFYRMLFSSDNVAYRDAYFRKAAQLLQDEGGAEAGENWSLVLDVEYTRTLFHSRRDGKMWMPFTKAFPLRDALTNSP
jgi:hypothetical protein